MKKFVLWLAVAAIAGAPAAGIAKHKIAKDQKPKQEESVFAKQSANTLRILRDGLPLILPSWLLPVYFNMHKDTDKNAKKQHEKM
jgi:hypothetical protein